jgi:ribonuclease P protein subunit RPR2
MGKKNKDEPDANSIANRDILQRMNFLYQASIYLNSLTRQPPLGLPEEPSVASSQRKRKRGTSRRTTTADISRSYIKSMKVVGRKTVVKMCVDPFPWISSG